MDEGDAAPGQAADRSGNPVVDPTKNVRELVDAAMRRQDDLRIAADRHVREIADLRAAYVREIADLRAAYDAMLRVQEAARLDAIRAVDVGAVNRAAEVSAQQAMTLASQVAQSAETLRTQVAATATAATVALAAQVEPLRKDIEELRRAQYETAGGKARGVAAGIGTGQIMQIISVLIAAGALLAVFLK